MATSSKKNVHIFWVCPSSESFFRIKGEVQCHSNSVIPKLVEKGIRLTVLIPFDPTLLPKSKLTPRRIHRQVVRLSQDFPVEFTKLTRAQNSPQIYMVKYPSLDPALRSAVFSKAALLLAKQINLEVDIFHLFGWQTSLVSLFLEIERENGGKEIFEKTKTFLNIQSLKDLGTFSPDVLQAIGIPKGLFHPDGIEFYGQVSLLKTGLLFSDEVGIIDNGGRRTTLDGGSVNGLRGLLNAVAPKLRRWASERSFKAHMDVYSELISHPRASALLPSLMKRLHSTPQAAESFFLSWGPTPPDRYNKDTLSFLIQSPVKGFCFWEWIHGDHPELGVLLEDHTTHRRSVLARGLSNLGEFWLDLEPNHVYSMELVGWTHGGRMETLLRSRRVRTPRNQPSENRNAIFIDVRTLRRFGWTGTFSWDDLSKYYGSSIGGSFGQGFSLNVPSSWRQKALL